MKPAPGATAAHASFSVRGAQRFIPSGSAVHSRLMSRAISATRTRSGLAARALTLPAAAIALIGAYIVLGSATLVMGRLTGDEGWYTYAAQLVLAGQLPHRDFAFTQPPLMPIVYAAWLALTGPGLLAARVLSFALGGVGIAFAMLAARRKAGDLAALLTGALVITNLSVVFDVCSVKTQALSVCLSGLTLWCAARAPARWASTWMLGAASALVATRLSMLPVLACCSLYALRGPQPRAAVISLFFAALLGSSWVLLVGPHALLFDTITFHSAWYGNPRWQWSGYGRSNVLGIIANQWPLLAAGLTALVLSLRPRTAPSEATPWLWLCVASYVTTTVVHISRPVSFPIYQTSNVLFLAAATGCKLSELERKPPVLALLAALSVLGWRTQEYPVSARGDGGLTRLDEAAEAIAQLSRDGDLLFTLSTELAVESKRPLLPGWSMSEFSYFPELPEAQLRPLGLRNRAMLLRDLSQARPAVVALTHHHAAMLGPEPMTAVRDHYRFALAIERYGQFYEPLYLFVRR